MNVAARYDEIIVMPELRDDISGECANHIRSRNEMKAFNFVDESIEDGLIRNGIANRQTEGIISKKQCRNGGH